MDNFAFALSDGTNQVDKYIISTVILTSIICVSQMGF